MESRSLAVAEEDRAPAHPKSGTGTRRAVDASDIGRPPDIIYPAGQVGLRRAEHEARADAAHRKRIAPAMEIEAAAAAGAADEPACLVDREIDRAVVGVGRRGNADANH